MDEPLRFEPLYMERVWGGREFEGLLGRGLPPDGKRYGESWELVDRDLEQSRVRSGEFAGRTLGELWREERERVFGRASRARAGAFPIMCKILDARDRLSVQVHPPEADTREHGGEPKSEMWYIVHADAGACLYAGVKRGVTRRSFEEALAKGECECQIHAIPARTGQFLYLPSGRLHAIGAGLVIYEIQQNSDTTYRVFDWNRLGTDGQPRPLHVEESLRCIDFADVEPGMGEPEGDLLVRCPWFHVERWVLGPGACREAAPEEDFGIFAVISGTVRWGAAVFRAGDWFLVPARGLESREMSAGETGAEILRTTLPAGS